MITLIQAVSVLGAIIGAPLAGNLAKYGIKRGLYVSNLILIVGLCVTFLPNIWLFALGRFIHGMSVGFYLFYGPVYLS